MLKSFVAASLFLLLVGSAQAGVVVVTNFADSGTGSLRDVVADPGTLAGDTVVFAVSSTPRVITLSSEIAIKKNLTILGPGAGLLTLQRGGGTAGMLIVDAGYTVVISGMTITGGVATSGGCVRHEGAKLTLSGVVISGCSTTSGRGAGVFVSATGGDLLIVSSSITNNASSNELGGGVAINDASASSKKTTILRSVISGNQARNGGGIYHASGTLLLGETELHSNTATTGPEGGGGLYVGISAGDISVRGSSFVGNTSAGSGGGISAIQLQPGQRFEVTQSLFWNNTAQFGAGVGVGQSSATAFISNSTFLENNGPAVFVFSSPGAPASSPTSTLYLSANTFSSNTIGLSLLRQAGPVVAFLRNNIFALNPLATTDTNIAPGLGKVYSMGYNPSERLGYRSRWGLRHAARCRRSTQHRSHASAVG